MPSSAAAGTRALDADRTMSILAHSLASIWPDPNREPIPDSAPASQAAWAWRISNKPGRVMAHAATAQARPARWAPMINNVNRFPIASHCLKYT